MNAEPAWLGGWSLRRGKANWFLISRGTMMKFRIIFAGDNKAPSSYLKCEKGALRLEFVMLGDRGWAGDETTVPIGIISDPRQARRITDCRLA